MSSTVDQQGDQITAQAQSLTSLTTSVNGITANARLKAEVMGGPTNFARIGFSASVSSGGATQSAGLYIDVPTNGGVPQVIVEASRFGVVSGGGAKANVFAVDSDGVYINDAYIRSISTDKITFKDGSVQTSALAQNAASQVLTAATAQAYTPGSSYENVLALAVTRNAGVGLLVFADLRAQITPGYEGQTLLVELWDQDNDVLTQTSITIPVAGAPVTAFLQYLSQTLGPQQFKLIVKGASGDATKFIIGRRTGISRGQSARH